MADASGVDGEGLQIGEGDVDWVSACATLDRVAPEATFIPEIWQGHKNEGEGFWVALDRLEDAWRRASQVVCQSAVRVMLSQQSGNIINVASTYSLVAPNQDLYRYPGNAIQTYKPVDYVGTKSMVPNFTRYLATLYGREGIRANCIVPHGVSNDHPREFRENFARMSPVGRMCEASELRGPFVFLASNSSSYMTGSTLVVDGGWTAW
jgi:NAD(P)-dependent dehydrogenase (short-subunit alcohol dehydrogenase family)